MTTTRQKYPAQTRLCLLGAAQDTGNLGVAALGQSACAGITRHIPSAHITLFDHTRGLRTRPLETSTTHTNVDLLGGYWTRRIHKPESLLRAHIAQRLGLPNNILSKISGAHAVLDVSGGDSFATTYGPSRFHAMCAQKELAINADTPLILLPQTFGPYKTTRDRQRAARITARASLAWARDTSSFKVLRDLLGDNYDPTRHKCAPDMAFALEPIQPNRETTEQIRWWLDSPAESRAVVNVSGLLWARNTRRAHDFGLVTRYRDAMRQIVRALAADDAGVLLVPHVRPEHSREGCDLHACDELLRELGQGEQNAGVVRAPLGPGQTKWIIAHAAWFTGARMHACIAGLSRGVPGAGIAYSDKMSGVFASCGLESQVIDARTLPTDDLVRRVIQSWRTRQLERERLNAALPRVLDRADSVWRDIASFLRVDRRAHRGLAA